MSEKKYPDEIYPGVVEIFGAKVAESASTADLEKAYDLGKAHGKEQATKADPLAGFSNLTRAIQGGTRIDWERLDGVVAKCVHPRVGTLTQKMELNKNDDPSNYMAWVNYSNVWSCAFDLAWQGESGWSLWIDGEVPLKPPTANELEPGTFFHAFYDGTVQVNMSRAQLVELKNGKKIVLCYNKEMDEIVYRFTRPENVEVLEVFGIGTLQSGEEEN